MTSVCFGVGSSYIKHLFFKCMFSRYSKGKPPADSLSLKCIKRSNSFSTVVLDEKNAKYPFIHLITYLLLQKCNVFHQQGLNEWTPRFMQSNHISANVCTSSHTREGIYSVPGHVTRSTESNLDLILFSGKMLPQPLIALLISVFTRITRIKLINSISLYSSSYQSARCYKTKQKKNKKFKAVNSFEDRAR